MYVYIQKSYQNLPNMGWAKIGSTLIILKISVKAKLYSKLFSKNYFDYFLILTFKKTERLSSVETEIFATSSSKLVPLGIGKQITNSY